MDATDAGMVVNVVGGGANFGVNFSSVSRRHPFAKQAEEVLVDARAEIGAGVARRRCLFLVLQGAWGPAGRGDSAAAATAYTALFTARIKDG